MSVALAPAKVNLYLHVAGKRPDGYHLLESLIVFADVGDTIEVRPAEELVLTVAGAFGAAVPASEENLVMRAARKLATRAQEVSGDRPGARLALTKNLPVAAGLGGGSTDAAATLLALDRLWRLDSPPEVLGEIAVSLGADVPACLAGGPVIARGIGEKLEPVPALPPIDAVVANPGISLATAEVFERFTGPCSGEVRFSTVPSNAAELIEFLGGTGNDLTEPASALAPEIDDTLGALSELPGCRLARMSGSGATCFGLFDDAAAARAAAARLKEERPGYWVAATRLGRR